MTDRNENRPGYKTTKVGWIPEDWEVVNLKFLCTEKSGIKTGPFGSQLHASDYVESGIPVIMPTNMSNGRVVNKNIARRLKPQSCKYGDILFARRGDLGRCALVKENEDGYLNGTGCLRVRLQMNKAHPEFMVAYFSTLYIKNWLERNAIGQTMLNLNAEIISSSPVTVSPLVEQKKIAKILSTWDSSIEQTRKLIDVKNRRKKALMQQLLTGKTKLTGFEEDNWEIAPLGRLISPVSRPVPKPDKAYLSIGLRSHCKGTFQKLIGEPEKIMMDTLYRVEPEDLILNITFAWEGAIAFASEDDSGGLVSHRFPTFRLKTKNAYIEFVRNLILTKRFIWDLGLISPGGAGRNRVMNKKDFLKIKVYVPSIKSQIKIGQVLSTAQDEINQLEAKLKALEKQKRGLMQKLLTGEVRVKVNDKCDPAEDNS